jgi:hypothetical protein
MGATVVSGDPTNGAAQNRRDGTIVNWDSRLTQLGVADRGTAAEGVRGLATPYTIWLANRHECPAGARLIYAYFDANGDPALPGSQSWGP